MKETKIFCPKFRFTNILKFLNTRVVFADGQIVQGNFLPIFNEIFKHLGSMLTNGRRCTCEIKSRIAMTEAAFNKKKIFFTSKLDLNLRKKLVEHGSVWC